MKLLTSTWVYPQYSCDSLIISWFGANGSKYRQTRKLLIFEVSKNFVFGIDFLFVCTQHKNHMFTSIWRAQNSLKVFASIFYEINLYIQRVFQWGVEFGFLTSEKCAIVSTFSIRMCNLLLASLLKYSNLLVELSYVHEYISKLLYINR